MQCSLRPCRLVAALLGVALAACAEPDPRSNVVLITIDSLRADHVSAYGFVLRTTPRLDALARRGARFNRAIAASTRTTPAHASIMTGLYPRLHSIGYGDGTTRLVGAATLAERFRDAGYATAAFVGSPLLGRRTGLDRGFDVYDDALPKQVQDRPQSFERPAPATTARALEWLLDVEPPFFLWVHYQDPHGPYTPDASFAERFQVMPSDRDDPLPVVESRFGERGIPAYQVLPNVFRPSDYRSRYAAEIATVDDSIGRLLKGVESISSDAAPPIIAVTGDHGEALGEREHWFSHGSDCLPWLARVPLIVVAPQLGPVEVNHMASHVDIAPTLLGLAGLPPLEGTAGYDQSALFRVSRARPALPALCDVGTEVAAYDTAGFTRITGTLDTWNGGAPPPEARWEHGSWTGAPSRNTSRMRPDFLRAYLRNVPALESLPED